MAMSAVVARVSSVAPDPAMIATFTTVALDGLEGWIAVRAFPEKGAPDVAPRLTFHDSGPGIAERLLADAGVAAQRGLATFVLPATVAATGSAKAADVVAMRTILVDLDDGDIEGKRDHLVRHLGHPSLEVASGGVTDEGQERLHLYWRLSAVASGEDLTRVCDLRHAIALKVGADPSFRSPHQPIRLPGSVYRKGGRERLVTVLADPITDHDLADLEARVGSMPSLVDRREGEEARGKPGDAAARP